MADPLYFSVGLARFVTSRKPEGRGVEIGRVGRSRGVGAVLRVVGMVKMVVGGGAEDVVGVSDVVVVVVVVVVVIVVVIVVVNGGVVVIRGSVF